MRQFTSCDPLDIGHQVVWNTLRILTDPAGLVRANRIEISQADCGKVRICICIVSQNNFNHSFCRAVRVGNISRVDLIVFLGLRVVGSVDGCARAEDDVVAVVFMHDL